ncbi:zinc finger protein 862-like [Corythoichthys intestinalis]|uniref:zinc finger protein 862-like n=1 Tax=Corythoichthys intestinalis TaxID=161448 RepID=UPI0025A547DD|nr:zinc finger protein 862-like [Corythoichthys intestinalis]
MKEASTIFRPWQGSCLMLTRLWCCRNGVPSRNTSTFKDKNQAEVLSLLASECDEWGQIYPLLSHLAGVALVIPVSSVNCERDFSTMNRVKSDLRNRLQGEHLAACLRVSINGPSPEAFNFGRAMEIFFIKAKKN